MKQQSTNEANEIRSILQEDEEPRKKQSDGQVEL